MALPSLSQSRRRFLRGAGLLAAGALSAPLAPAAEPDVRRRTLVLSDRLRAALEGARKHTIRQVEYLVRPQAGWIALRIEAASGLEGFGLYTASQHTFRWTRPDGAQADLAALLVGRSPADLETVWNAALADGLPLGLLWIADLAIWDLVGRAAGQPVHRLLGGRREKLACYASSPVAIGEPDKYVEQARWIFDRGYHGYKVHPYFNVPKGVYPSVLPGEVGKDKTLLVALREALGPKAPLMWDNFRSYGHHDALDVGRLAGKHGYLWLEDPVNEDNSYHMNEYVRLRKALKGAIPLCGPEHAHGGHWERVEWMHAGAVDINRCDANYGGFTGQVLLAEACAAAGVPLELHFHQPHEYNLQVAGCSPEKTVRYLEVFEGPPGKSREDFLAGRTRRRAADGNPVGRLDVADIDLTGHIPLPDLPGLGPDVDWPQLQAST